MKGNHLPNLLTGQESVEEMVARVSARVDADNARKATRYRGRADAADPELDQRLVELSAAGHNPPAGMSLRDLRRWADLAERRMDAQRMADEQDAQDERWTAEQAELHAEVESRKQAEAQARAEARALVDSLSGPFGGGR